ncbi:MAG: sulfatase [Cyclobacteriaceae bacterium]|uniref:sulfatase n=1 Tax=Reichenbachiella sp. TaxID=2184521 RepID=UPI0032668762
MVRLLFKIWGLVILNICCSQACGAQEKPNILMIMIDDLNDYVGCMNGSVSAYSPNIDRLAQDGILFTNAHSQAPLCGPSRASLMTGLYPSTSGNYLQLNDVNIKKSSEAVSKSIFLPDYLESYGYKTLGVGKIFHKGDQASVFDEFGGKFDWYGPKPAQRMNYDPATIPGKTGNTSTDWGAFPHFDSLMTDHKSAQWAIKKLKETHEKPFFLTVGFIRPHVPLMVPQRWFDLIDREQIEFPPYLPNDFDDIPEMGKKVSEAPMMPTTEELIKSNEWKDVLHAYLASVAFVDAQVGKVLDALQNSSYADNTIIVLLSDHGYHLGEKNRFAKQALWERDTRVPMIIKPLKANFESGMRINQPVQLLDIYPTSLDLCGLPPNDQLEGHSVTPLFAGQTKWNHCSLSIYGEGNIAIRNRQYRLIQYEDGSQELYDLINDPNEWKNLTNSPEHQNLIRELKSHIPKEWAKNSLYSKYTFNEYFINRYK